MAHVLPAWLYHDTVLGPGVSALPGTWQQPCAAPVLVPAGTTGALRGARQELSPPGALACGVDRMLSWLRALPGSQAWHMLEPSCQSL